MHTTITRVRLPAGDGLSGLHDLVLKAGRIVEITSTADSRTPAGNVFDAGGRICLPGLVDSHSHAAAAVFDPAIQLALLRQGVTTIIVGQDGIGFAPSDERSLAWTQSYFAGIDGKTERIKAGDIAHWLASYDNATSINVAALVPHGSLRYLVTGAAQRPSTKPEVLQMAQYLAAAFDQGAVGFSTGLEYVPAAWADHLELTELLRVTAASKRVHTSHMRGYEEKAPKAVAELVELAQQSGVSTSITHYHGDAQTLGGLLDEAAAAGVPMTFDSYPYLRGCSLLAMVSLPTWLPLADPRATLDLLANDASAQNRLASHLAALTDLWPRTTLAWADGTDPATGAALSWTVGLTVPQIASQLQTTEADAVLRLLVGTELRAACVFAQPPTNSAASVSQLADRPEHMAGSDGIYVPFSANSPLSNAGKGVSGSQTENSAAVVAPSRSHPRGWGAMTRWLTTKVLSGDWSWADAVEHLAARAVRRYGLGERGRLAVGAVADLILVDEATLQDAATYEQPRSLATGIADIWVAGVQVLADGELTGENSGMGLRWERNTR